MNHDVDLSAAGQVIHHQSMVSGRSRLYVATLGIIKLTLLLSGSLLANGVAYADNTTDLNTVPVSPPEYDPPTYDPPDVGWDNGGTGGGGGSDGGGGTDYPPASCDFLRSTKPANCPNPIPMPTGPAYGRQLFASGGAIPKILNFIENQPYTSEAARFWARNALDYQTHAFAERTMSYDQVMESVLGRLSNACTLQTQADEGIRWSGTSATVAERACYDMMDTVRAEANTGTYSNLFIWWSNKEGVSLSDLGIPQTFINLFSPQNSIRVKYDAVTEDAKCAQWWIQVQQNQCSL